MFFLGTINGLILAIPFGSVQAEPLDFGDHDGRPGGGINQRAARKGSGRGASRMKSRIGGVIVLHQGKASAARSHIRGTEYIVVVAVVVRHNGTAEILGSRVPRSTASRPLNAHQS